MIRSAGRRAVRVQAGTRRSYSSPNKKERDEMEASRVPTSQFERMYHYGQLATSLGLGVLSEGIKRLGSNGSDGSLFLSKGNLDRMVRKLSRMRGAALKIGQLISFQDERIIPKEIQEMLSRLQSRANYMPPKQFQKVMSSSLGSDWRGLFTEFEDRPFAAASIGQVHRAMIGDQKVAVKVQFPGVADSIDSDLSTLSLLLLGSRLLPEGMFLDKTIENARTELAWECDYVREANCAIKYNELLLKDPVHDSYKVPKVFTEQSTNRVLTMEFLEGHEITKLPAELQTQKVHNDIATRIMRLCLTEIARFRFMQTDPNWANFLLNRSTNQLELLDFGATREYSNSFVEKYLNILRAAVREDREACEHFSVELGYLTGLESKAMREAHVDSIIILGEPFRTPNYDFRNQTVTDRVRGNIGLMLKERLTPPPEETYGLHRKLSGAFLLCARLNATVPCGDLFNEIVTV